MAVGFVDTGAWIALLVRRDSHHEATRRFFADLPVGLHLVTSQSVIGEAATWLAYHGYRPAAVALRAQVAAASVSSLLTLEVVTDAVYEAAWDVFERFSDQSLSFCDCTSYILARSHRADFVVGFDRDFMIMGFDLRP